MSIQHCPVETCDATYAPAVLEATDNHCPACDTPIVSCPVCERLVELGAVWDQNACPSCQTHRLDLGDAVRDDTTEVAGS